MSARKKNNSIGEPFVYLTIRQLKSPAFKQLTNAARLAYILLRSQVKEHGQKEVVFLYSQASEYMKPHTFSKAIKQLEDLGFIERSERGGMYRRTNVFRLIEKWRAVK